MKSVKTCIVLFSVAVAASMPAFGADFEVLQKDKKFSVKVLKVKMGDTVNFKNEDPFVHNIFSLSDVKTFDLGSYPQGQAKKIVFDKPGTVEIECSIHPDMKMVVEVQK